MARVRANFQFNMNPSYAPRIIHLRDQPGSREDWLDADTQTRLHGMHNPKGVALALDKILADYKDVFKKSPVFYVAEGNGRRLLQRTEQDFKYLLDNFTTPLVHAHLESRMQLPLTFRLAILLHGMMTDFIPKIDDWTAVYKMTDDKHLYILVMCKCEEGCVIAFQGLDDAFQVVFCLFSDHPRVMSMASNWCKLHLPPGTCSEPSCEGMSPQLKCCGDTRYCRKACQKKHWAVHKHECIRDKQPETSVAARHGVRAEMDAADLSDTRAAAMDAVETGMAAMTVGTPAAVTDMCIVCGAEGRLLCCNSIRYCSKQCQKEHWKAHKIACLRGRKNASHGTA
jgi:hypothetical protein